MSSVQVFSRSHPARLSGIFRLALWFSMLSGTGCVWAVESIAGRVATSAARASTPATPVVPTVLISSSHSWDGAPLPAYPAGTPEISIVRISLPPGVALPMHRHPFINAGVLLSGELTITLKNQQQKVLKAGEGLLEVVDTWHFGTSTGTEAAEIIVFYAGTTGQAITQLEPATP